MRSVPAHRIFLYPEEVIPKKWKSCAVAQDPRRDALSWGTNPARMERRRQASARNAQVECPICGRSFPADMINDHANACAYRLDRKTGTLANKPGARRG